MDNENLQPLKDLLVEAEKHARMVRDGFKDGQAGYQTAYFIHSDVCKALSHLRVLKALNV